MAKYKKRKDGRYQANIDVGYDDETGKRKFETIYATSIRELEEKKSEIKDRLNKGTYSNDKGLTVEEWAVKWFNTHKATAGVRTKEMYERLVYKHIIPSIGGIRLKNLLKTDVQEMINERQEHPRTCQQLKICLNQILESAIDDGLIYKNVCKKINMPSHIKEEKRGLADIEKKAIESADFTDKERAYVYLIQYTGIRRGEALALTKNDIDPKSNVVHIRNSITFEGNTGLLKPIPKSIAGIRDIPMPSTLSKFMGQYLKELKSIYLFEMSKGGIMSKSSYVKFWNKIIEKINIAAGGTKDIKAIHNLGAHVFRHNYATMLFYAGVDIKESQYLLGHSDVKLTLNIYTHLDNKKSSAVDKLNTFLAM